MDTSANHVMMVLEEMLYGAIEASGPDKDIVVSVERSQNGWTALVAVSDQGKLLSDWERSAIEAAAPVKPVGGRAWGLALAQSVALNVGARIEVASTESGNYVRLRLPLSIR
jgi:sensor histidine kinase regulating citrate/malate metabolism